MASPSTTTPSSSSKKSSLAGEGRLKSSREKSRGMMTSSSRRPYRQNRFVDVPSVGDIKVLTEGTPNEESEFLEFEELDGLTLYDIHRQPRKQVTDVSEVEVPCRLLNADLTCPVCLGIIRETMVVMECLHRFCSQCITKSLRVGKKECPSCRIHVPSKRSLRRDPNFDAIIKTLYPNLEEYEEQEEKLIEEMNKRAVVNAFSDACKRGQERQQASRRKSTNSAGSSGKTEAGPSSKKPRREPDPREMIDFILRKHPLETRVRKLDREFLRTSKQIKVAHLLRFLGKKLSYEPMEHFEILMLLGGNGIILDTKLTIGELSASYWDDEKREMVLHYRLRPQV